MSWYYTLHPNLPPRTQLPIRSRPSRNAREVGLVERGVLVAATRESPILGRDKTSRWIELVPVTNDDDGASSEWIMIEDFVSEAPASGNRLLLVPWESTLIRACWTLSPKSSSKTSMNIYEYPSVNAPVLSQLMPGHVVGSLDLVAPHWLVIQWQDRLAYVKLQKQDDDRPYHALTKVAWKDLDDISMVLSSYVPEETPRVSEFLATQLAPILLNARHSPKEILRQVFSTILQSSNDAHQVLLHTIKNVSNINHKGMTRVIMPLCLAIQHHCFLQPPNCTSFLFQRGLALVQALLRDAATLEKEVVHVCEIFFSFRSWMMLNRKDHHLCDFIYDLFLWIHQQLQFRPTLLCGLTTLDRGREEEEERDQEPPVLDLVRQICQYRLQPSSSSAYHHHSKIRETYKILGMLLSWECRIMSKDVDVKNLVEWNNHPHLGIIIITSDDQYEVFHEAQVYHEAYFRATEGCQDNSKDDDDAKHSQKQFNTSMMMMDQCQFNVRHQKSSSRRESMDIIDRSFGQSHGDLPQAQVVVIRDATPRNTQDHNDRATVVQLMMDDLIQTTLAPAVAPTAAPTTLPTILALFDQVFPPPHAAACTSNEDIFFRVDSEWNQMNDTTSPWVRQRLSIWTERWLAARDQVCTGFQHNLSSAANKSQPVPASNPLLSSPELVPNVVHTNNDHDNNNVTTTTSGYSSRSQGKYHTSRLRRPKIQTSSRLRPPSKQLM